jgi:hypothetical protein
MWLDPIAGDSTRAIHVEVLYYRAVRNVPKCLNNCLPVFLGLSTLWVHVGERSLASGPPSLVLRGLPHRARSLAGMPGKPCPHDPPRENGVGEQITTLGTFILCTLRNDKYILRWVHEWVHEALPPFSEP